MLTASGPERKQDSFHHSYGVQRYASCLEDRKRGPGRDDAETGRLGRGTLAWSHDGLH